MNYLLRFVVSVLLLVLVLVGACVTRPAVLEELGLDVWQWPGATQSLDMEQHRKEGLDERMEAA